MASQRQGGTFQAPMNPASTRTVLERPSVELPRTNQITGTLVTVSLPVSQIKLDIKRPATSFSFATNTTDKKQEQFYG